MSSEVMRCGIEEQLREQGGPLMVKNGSGSIMIIRSYSSRAETDISALRYDCSWNDL